MDRKYKVIGVAAVFLFLLPKIIKTEKPEIFYAIFGLVFVACLVITEKSPWKH